MKYKVITARLKARTAIHIGSGEASETTDALIRRESSGLPVIPGTAIAGALRALLTRLGPRLGAGTCESLKRPSGATAQLESCQCGVCRLFGDIHPSEEEGTKSYASRLLVFNAVITGGRSETFIRDGVGIDRVTGTSARAGRAKFDFEVLPAGTTFNLRLELRRAQGEDEMLLAAALSEWRSGRIWLGGGATRGLGVFELSEIEFKTLELATPEQLLDFLKADKPCERAAKQEDWLSSQVKVITTSTPITDIDKNCLDHVARRWVKYEGKLQGKGPLLTNDATTSGLRGFDHAPLLAQLDNWEQPVLAGAGLRGVLRSHAERIARTLATLEADGQEAFCKTCPACSPVESRAESPLASCDSLLRKAEVSANEEVVDHQLCLACRLFGSTRRGSRLVVEDALYQPTQQQEKPVLKMLDFLAIDRFTGGGADGAKFDALALWKPAFAFRLYLDNPKSWELGWLELVLRDMVAGWLHVGMGTAKGFGRVKLLNLHRTLGYFSRADIDDLSLKAEGQRTDDSLYWEMPFTLTLDQAKIWADDFRKIVKTDCHRSENGLPPLEVDSYFVGVVDHLYKKEVTL